MKLYHPAGAGDNAPIAKQRPVVTEPAQRTTSAKGSVSREDQQWLDSVAARPPAVQASFRADLDNANSFIRDAEASLRDDPNDAYTQQMLIKAYEQKQMLYELAVDRDGQ